MSRKIDFTSLVVTVIGFATLFIWLPANSGGKSVLDKDLSINMIPATSQNINVTKQKMDYDIIPLTRLIGMADLIVIGSVEDIGDSTFTLHVDESLSHQHSSELISVTKYIPLENILAAKSLSYDKGQRFSLFLMKAEQHSSDPSWNILGIAGEGEMPIENELVNIGTYDLKELGYKPVDDQGVTRSIQWLNLDDFIDAVRKYRICFSWKVVEYIKNNKKRTRWVPAKMCHDELIKNYREKSELHEYLVNETIHHIPQQRNK